MLRHWLVRNGSHVEDTVVYIKTSDECSDNQLQQILSGIKKLGWELDNVYVIEKATSKAHKPLKQFVLEMLRR